MIWKPEPPIKSRRGLHMDSERLLKAMRAREELNYSVEWEEKLLKPGTFKEQDNGHNQDA